MAEQYPEYNEVADQVGLHSEAQRANIAAQQNNQMQVQMEEAESNLADKQLDCEETLTKIAHLLKQDNLRLDDETQVLKWFEIEDQKKRVLTDEGVDKLMQIAQSYINKETLLSNFDEKTIKKRMLKFALSLSALIFLKYELYFRTPSIEECQVILQDRIKDRIKKRKMACEILEEEFNEAEIKKEIHDELRVRMESELTKIKDEKTKINLREFEIIFTQMEALVEATHNRAWKGEERGSLRRHTSINEVIGGKPQGQEKKRWFGL